MGNKGYVTELLFQNIDKICLIQHRVTVRLL